MNAATAVDVDVVALQGSEWRVSDDGTWEDQLSFGEAIDQVIRLHAHYAVQDDDTLAEVHGKTRRDGHSLDLSKIVAQMCAHAAVDSDSEDVEELHALLEDLPDISTGWDVTVRRMG